MNKEITLEQLASYETAFDDDRANRIAMDAVTKNGVNNAAMRFENAREMRHTFNISLEQGDITNQKQSGRCWMFAALNTMRFRIIKSSASKRLSSPRITRCSSISLKRATISSRAS